VLLYKTYYCENGYSASIAVGQVLYVATDSTNYTVSVS